jgi:hypothetical protein
LDQVRRTGREGGREGGEGGRGMVVLYGRENVVQEG